MKAGLRGGCDLDCGGFYKDNGQVSNRCGATEVQTCLINFPSRKLTMLKPLTMMISIWQ